MSNIKINAKKDNEYKLHQKIQDSLEMEELKKFILHAAEEMNLEIEFKVSITLKTFEKQS